MARNQDNGADERAGSSLDGLFEVAKTGRTRTSFDAKGPTSSMTDDLSQIIAENKRRKAELTRIRLGEKEEVRAHDAPRDSSMDDPFVADGARHRASAASTPRKGGELGLDDVFGGGGGADGGTRKPTRSTLDDFFDK